MTKFESSTRIITLRDFVVLPFNFFSLVGIKFFHWDASDIMTTKEKILFVVVSLCVVLNFLAKCAYFVFDEFHSNFQMIEWGVYLSFAVNGLFKMCSVILGRKILSRTLKLLELIMPRNSKERRDFKLTEGFHYIMRHSKIMYISHCVIAMMFIIFPLVQSSVEYLSTRGFVARLPYIMTYPFDITVGITYVLVYISQFIAGSAVSCYYLGSDVLLICTIYVVILQFKYLCYRIEHFESKNYQQDMRELKDILKKHNLLNNLARDVNEVFSISILLNYMISIILIVLIGIQIVAGSELLDCVKFLGFLLVTITEVYYVCMFGTKLMEQSVLVGEIFVGQKWYMADVRYQRMLVIAIARSQRPAQLTAFKFFIISMESFSNLMTTSYQFFTLLKTRMEE